MSMTLYGFSASNYYNKAKLALLESGAVFTEHAVYPTDVDKTGSPLKKVPYLQTAQGMLCESQVIVDYVAQTQAGNALYPADAFEAAKVRELCTFLDVHLELVARRLYPEALFGGTVSDGLKASTKKDLIKNIRGFMGLAKFAPFVAGDSFTAADIAAYTHLPLLRMVGKKIYGEDLFEGYPQFDIRAYLAMLNARPAFAKTGKDAAAAMAGFNEYVKKASQAGLEAAQSKAA